MRALWFIVGVGTGVCLMDTAHDIRAMRAAQMQVVPAQEPATAEERCYHWALVGQGWRCL